MIYKDEMLERVAENATYTKIENYLIDGVIPKLTKNEIVILLHCYRWTIGFNKTVYKDTYKKIDDTVGIRSDLIHNILSSLSKKQLLVYNRINKNHFEVIVDRKFIKYQVLQNC